MERPPLRNPYDAFTGSDLDTFVASIRAKVGTALNPRPLLSTPSLSPEPSPADKYITRLAQSVRSEALHGEPISPPPNTLDKGKGRALDEGPGLQLNGAYSDIDQSEDSAGEFLTGCLAFLLPELNRQCRFNLDQVSASLGDKIAETGYISALEGTEDNSTEQYEEEEEIEEAEASQDEEDGEAGGEGEEVDHNDDVYYGGEVYYEENSDRELSPDAAEHPQAAEDYHIDDDGAIVIDSDDEDGEAEPQQAQSSPDWAVQEGFVDAEHDADDQAVEEEEEALPGEYGLEPQFDDQEADQLFDEDVSAYPVERGEEFVDLETDIVYGEDDTSPAEDQDEPGIGYDDQDELADEEEAGEDGVFDGTF